MKNVFAKLLFLSALIFVAAPQVFAQVQQADETNWPIVIIGAVIVVVEIIARTIDNPKVTGIIGLVINLLKNISDYLNRGKQ